MTGKDIIKITLNLVVVYMIGGIILAAVYAKSSPIIFQNNVKAEQNTLGKLIPGAVFDKMGEWSPHEKHAKYFVAKKNGETVGYVVQSFGKGYSSYINTFIAVDKDFKVQKIDILAHGETPGLGDEIEAAWFKDQFKDKSLEHLKVIKGETKEDIQAISGATISSRAVTEDAVKNGVAFLIKTVNPVRNSSGALDPAISNGVKEGGSADVKPER